MLRCPIHVTAAHRLPPRWSVPVCGKNTRTTLTVKKILSWKTSKEGKAPIACYWQLGIGQMRQWRSLSNSILARAGNQLIAHLLIHLNYSFFSVASSPAPLLPKAPNCSWLERVGFLFWNLHVFMLPVTPPRSQPYRYRPLSLFDWSGCF